MSPVVLHGDLLPRPDGAPGLHPEAAPGLQREPGVTHAAVVTQGEGGEYAATLDTLKWENEVHGVKKTYVRYI